MTGKTGVWPVKSAIRPDIVRWPAVICSPELGKKLVFAEVVAYRRWSHMEVRLYWQQGASWLWRISWGWSNQSETVKYCEGIMILTVLVLLGITLHLNHYTVILWYASRGGLFISNPSDGGLDRDLGSLFNLAKTMVSVLHKELEYKVERLKYVKLEVMEPRIRNKSELQVGK